LSVIRLARIKVESGHVLETQIYNDFGGCEKVGKQDYSCAACKFKLAAFLLTPRGHQGIAQFLDYLSWVDRPALLSISNCISAADNYP
jgi:hypothetical protein